MAITLVLSSIFIVFPIVARIVGDAAVRIEPGSAKTGIFFWLIAALAALPAAGFTIVIMKLRGANTVQEEELSKLWIGLVLLYLAFGWPMFTMGTQYKSVSTVRFADRVGLSIRGSEFLQDTALVAFSVSFTSFFSMYVFHFAFRKLGRRAARLVVAVYFAVELVVFVMVGRAVGDGYW